MTTEEVVVYASQSKIRACHVCKEIWHPSIVCKQFQRFFTKQKFRECQPIRETYWLHSKCTIHMYCRCAIKQYKFTIDRREMYSQCRVSMTGGRCMTDIGQILTNLQQNYVRFTINNRCTVSVE